MKSSQRSAGVAYLEVSGGRLAYEVHGPETGRLVISMHGMGYSRASFRFLTPLLVAAGYRGRRHRRARARRLVRRLDRPQPASGGRRSGRAGTGTGRTGQRDRQPLRCWCGSVRGHRHRSDLIPDPDLHPCGTAPAQPLRAAQGLVLRSPRLWGIYFRSLFVTEKPPDLDVYIRNQRADLRRPGGMRAVRELIAPGDRSWREVAAEITVPVLIVHGSKDPDYPDAEAAARASQAPLTSAAAVRIEMIEGAEHYPHVEMPDRTAGPILAFPAGLRA